MRVRNIFCSTVERLKELQKSCEIDLPLSVLGRRLILVENAGPSAKKMFSEHQIPELEVFSAPQSKHVFIYPGQIDSWPAEWLNSIPILSTTSLNPQKQNWTLRGKNFIFGEKPYVMGILNVTPDSFSDGGQFDAVERAVEHALQMIDDGVDIIDAGGESTRPGAQKVDEQEEMDRVVPVIEAIRKESDIPLSVDTYKSPVAKSCLTAGADIINDISGGQFDPEMVAVAATFNCPLVVMHIQGTPRDMQQNPTYRDVMAEIGSYFEERIQTLTAMGLKYIALDPGIGFGKRHMDNMILLRDLRDFSWYGYPVLMGLSRKSFIGRELGLEVTRRDAASLAANIWSVLQGADILRVHDVRLTRQAVDMFMAINYVKKDEQG